MKTIVWLALSLILIACQDKDLHFYVRFSDPGGLQPGDRVLLAGREAGQVVDLKPVEDGSWWVAVEVKSEFREQVTRGSTFTIVADPGRPGRLCLAITPNPAGEAIRDDAVVEGSDPLPQIFGPLFKGLSEGLGNLERQFRQFSQELERLPQSPEYRRMQRRLESLLRRLQEAEEKMQQEVIPQLEKDLERLRRELERAGPRRRSPPERGERLDL